MEAVFSFYLPQAFNCFKYKAFENYMQDGRYKRGERREERGEERGEERREERRRERRDEER